MMHEVDEKDLKLDSRDFDSNQNCNHGDVENNTSIKICVDDEEIISNSPRNEVIHELSPTNANVDSLLNELAGLLHDDEQIRENNSDNLLTLNHSTPTSNGVRSDLGTAVEETNVEKMSKFYEKYSQQCFEIEKYTQKPFQRPIICLKNCFVG